MVSNLTWPLAISIATITACVGDAPAVSNDAGTPDVTIDTAPEATVDSAPAPDVRAETGPCNARDGGSCYADVCGGNDVMQVSAGGAGTSCVLLRAGEVWCWGASQAGQLGVAPATISTTCTTYDLTSWKCRATPAKIAGLPRLTSISVANHVCGIDLAGDVWCWGKNSRSQLGHIAGGSGDISCPLDFCNPIPSKVAGISNAVEVVALEQGTCVRTNIGSVYCWGDNRFGTVGNGKVENIDVTTPYLALQGSTSISGGLNAPTTCAIKSGAAFCWGRNVQGGAGHAEGTLGDTACAAGGGACNGTPLQVSGLPGSVSVVQAGQNSACALTSAGKVFCWGGLPGASFPPVDMGLTGAQALSSRTADNACALDASNKVWCWGVNFNGNVGTGKVSSMSTPEGAAACSGMWCYDKPQQTGFTALSLSVGFSILAVGADKRAWGWGLNEFGQTGHPPATQGDKLDCKGVFDQGGGRPCNATPIKVQGLP